MVDPLGNFAHGLVNLRRRASSPPHLRLRWKRNLFPITCPRRLKKNDKKIERKYRQEAFEEKDERKWEEKKVKRWSQWGNKIHHQKRDYRTRRIYQIRVKSKLSSTIVKTLNYRISRLQGCPAAITFLASVESLLLFYLPSTFSCRIWCLSHCSTIQIYDSGYRGRLFSLVLSFSFRVPTEWLFSLRRSRGERE